MELKGLADQVKRYRERHAPATEHRRPKRRVGRSMRQPAQVGIEIARAAVEEFAKKLRK
jgi:hypothetical protein